MGTGQRLRTNALTTLEALKQLLGIDETDTSQDSVLIQLINRASASIENALGRKLRRSTYTERVKGTGSQYLLVENYPIVAVEEIKAGREIVDPGLYDITVRGNAGVIYKDDGWTYYGFPTADRRRRDGSRNITVRYTADISCHGKRPTKHPLIFRQTWRGWHRKWCSTSSGSWRAAAAAA